MVVCLVIESSRDLEKMAAYRVSGPCMYGKAWHSAHRSQYFEDIVTVQVEFDGVNLKDVEQSAEASTRAKTVS